MNTADPDSTSNDTSDELVFNQWSKYEDIAMHFNDLIMRWRLQAIGGLAALVTLGGSVVGGVANFEQRYWAMILLTTTFLCVWLGLGALDLFYYRKLLSGAVKELLEFEKKNAVRGKPIRMSTTIEKHAESGGKFGPWIFYALGAAPLCFILAYACCKLSQGPSGSKTIDEEIHLKNETPSASARSSDSGQ
jgi:hypothetical protein